MRNHNKAVKRNAHKKIYLNKVSIFCDQITCTMYLFLILFLPFAIPTVVSSVVLDAVLSCGIVVLLIDRYFDQRREITKYRYENAALKMQCKTGVECDLTHELNLVQIKGKTYADYLKEQDTKTDALKRIKKVLLRAITYVFAPIALVLLILQPDINDYAGDITICVLVLVGGIAYLIYRSTNGHKQVK